MKLIFKKEKEKVNIFIRNELKEEIFNYVNMIKYLIDGNEFEKSEFIGDLSVQEKEKINDMIKKISKVVIDEKISLENDEDNENDFNNEEPQVDLAEGQEIDVKDIPF
jgi:hypothetical protein